MWADGAGRKRRPLTPVEAPKDAVELEERLITRGRLKSVLLFGLIVWIVSYVLDWTVHRYVEPGSLGWMWSVRTGQTVVLAGVFGWLLRSRRPSLVAQRRALWLVALTTSVATALLSLGYGGIDSPYSLAVASVLAAAGVAMPDHARRGAFVLGTAALAYPITLLAAAPFSARVQAQLGDQAVAMRFLHETIVTLVTAGLLCVGGHVHWALRRQIFEQRHVGRYRLKERIARGGMGEVWRAYHPALRVDVAIKLIRSHEVSEAAVARFEGEVSAMAALGHPNTVRVLDFGSTDDGLRFYVMELVEGENLGVLVDREGPLPPPRAAFLVLQAARALAEAHANAIVHRDVKPENLLVTAHGGEEDFVKVIDFGVARAIVDDFPPSAAITREGTVVGTPQFMAPEQARGLPTDARADVFALGAVLYYALTGRRPFEGDDPSEIAMAHVLPVVAPSVVVGAAVPASLEEICIQCLAIEPAGRCVNALELADALEATGLPQQWKPRHAGKNRGVAGIGSGARSSAGDTRPIEHVTRELPDRQRR